MIGSRIGHYLVERELGRGGMGVVYQARDESLGRPVAIKVIAQDALASDVSRRRFLREARSAAALSHAFVCRVIELIETGDELYLVMEFVTGATLDGWLREQQPALAQLLRVGGEIAEAVAAAHAAGIIHRDIKPANVMITAGGHPKIMDFGLAKTVRASAEAALDEGQTEELVTRDGAIAGTPGYVAPEVLLGGEASPASDLFALGCLLYFMTTGSKPFSGRTPMEGITRTLTAEPAPPSSLNPALSGEIDSLIAALLAKEPAGRPESAAAVADALAVMARTASARGESVQLSERRLRGQPVAVAGGIALLIVALSILIWWMRARAPALPGHDLAILPLGSSPSVAPGFSARQQLHEKMAGLGAELRVLPDERITELYREAGVSSAEPASPELLARVARTCSHTMLWEVTGSDVAVEVVRGDEGELWQHWRCPLPDNGQLDSPLLERLARDLGALLQSVRPAEEPYPAGYEHLRPRPITWSDQAASLYRQALRLTHTGHEWEANLLLERALQIDPDFAQAMHLQAYALSAVEIPYVGSALILPLAGRALELRHRLEPWEVALLERAQRFLEQGAGPGVEPLPASAVGGLGTHLRTYAIASDLLFRGETDALLELSNRYLRTAAEPQVLWTTGIPLALSHPAEQRAAIVEGLIEAHPDSPMAHVTAGVLLIGIPDRVEQAEAMFARARDLDGGRWRPWLAWEAAKMELGAGRVERAEEILREAIDSAAPGFNFQPGTALEEMERLGSAGRQVDPRLLAILAMTCRSSGRYDEALHLLESHRTMLPASPWSDYESGRVHAEAGHPLQAVEAFSGAIELDPRYPWAYLRRGTQLRVLGRDDEACPDLERFIELTGSTMENHPRVREARQIVAESCG